MDVNIFKQDVDKCVTHITDELSHIHTGRANPELVEGVKVEAYGMENPLKNVASVSVSDSRSLLIQPWDKTIKEAIVKGITASNLGFTSSVEGDVVRVNIPELTQERRLQFIKVMKEKVENGRISVRNVRHEAMKAIDLKISNGLPKDEGDRLKEDVEKYVKTTNEKIEEIRKTKETDLMTI